MRRKTIPGYVTELRYKRTGAAKGHYFHPFKPGVKMLALNDGSVKLVGPKRIHADDSEPGFWERYGHRRGGQNVARRRRRARRSRGRGKGDNTLLLVGAAVLGYMFLTGRGVGAAIPPATIQRPGDAQAFIPQPGEFWINPNTQEWVQAGADGLPPGTVPPWRVMSQSEYVSLVSGGSEGFLT